MNAKHVVHVGVTRAPTEQWTAQQLREATPFGKGAQVLIRDRDTKSGALLERVAEGASIEGVLTAPCAPRINSVAERFLGGVRRPGPQEAILDQMPATGYTNARMRDLAQFLKVVADEARLEILWLLLNHEELCVCDLMEALEMTQSKTSRHLATLRHAGLIVDRKEAAWSYSSLRSSESEVERNPLKSLRAELGRHPGAARVLQRLQA